MIRWSRPSETTGLMHEMQDVNFPKTPAVDWHDNGRIRESSSTRFTILCHFRCPHFLVRSRAPRLQLAAIHLPFFIRLGRIFCAACELRGRIFFEGPCQMAPENMRLRFWQGTALEARICGPTLLLALHLAPSHQSSSGQQSKPSLSRDHWKPMRRHTPVQVPRRWLRTLDKTHGHPFRSDSLVFPIRTIAAGYAIRISRLRRCASASVAKRSMDMSGTLATPGPNTR